MRTRKTGRAGRDCRAEREGKGHRLRLVELETEPERERRQSVGEGKGEGGREKGMPEPELEPEMDPGPERGKERVEPGRRGEGIGGMRGRQRVWEGDGKGVAFGRGRQTHLWGTGGVWERQRVWSWERGARPTRRSRISNVEH
ncbi:hypothetical protein ACLOJK_020996 [Asimina triloba]